MARRVVYGYFGIVRRVRPQKAGAEAQCLHCPWFCFVEDKKRQKWAAIHRAAAKLRDHERRTHKDKFPQFSDGDFHA